MKTVLSILCTLTATVCCLVIWYISGFPIVLNNDKEVFCYNQSNDKVNPLKDIDFAKGDCKMLLIFNDMDWRDLPSGIPHRKVLVTSDNKILSELQRSFEFEFMNCDIATVSSEIIIVKDGDIVFKSGIVLDNNQLILQNSKTGAISSIKKDRIFSLFSLFKPYKGVILNVR